MNKLKLSRTTRAIALALAVTPVAGVVYAAGMGGSGMDDGDRCGRGEARHERHHGADRGERHRGKQEVDRHVDGRMAFLKAEIAITEAQESQWQAVEDVLRARIEKRAEHMAERRGQRAERAESGAPDRLAGHIEAMEARLEHLKAMESAVSDLYAVLTPEQQASADELLPGPGMGRGGFKGPRFMR